MPPPELPKEGEEFLQVNLDETPIEEGDPLSDPLPSEEPLDELTQAEKELYNLIEQNLEPIKKECIEWEQRILRSANLSFFKSGDATKSYHRPTLPYPLLKFETLKTKERLTPECPLEEIGGYQPITLSEWQTAKVMKHQPP